MKFLDLFAGIGGFRLGMERAGHECVGYVEFDKFARRSYEAIHDTEGEWTAHDITTVTDDDIRQLRDRGRIDVICGGFPCQAFSVAGNRGGFDDTRGTLFFDIVRFANIIRPQYLFLENVRGLLSHDEGNTFETILRTLDDIGYDVEWDLLNSKDFGVPQNRERIFIVGHLRGPSRREVFPVGGKGGNSIKVYGRLEGNFRSTSEVLDTRGISTCLNTMSGGDREPKIILPVLTPDRLKKRQNGRRFKESGEPMFTLTSQDRHGLYDGHRIRKLTPKECWRLQGFSDELFNKAQAVNSDSQLYKQSGNSVTVNVIHEIAKKIGGI